MAKHKKNFNGKLVEPIERPKARSLADWVIFGEDGKTPSEKKWEARVLEKLSLLMDHYGLEGQRRNGDTLALMLAFDFVPGFSEEKSRGEKPKWNRIVRTYLVAEIVRIRDRNTGISIKAAAFEVSKLEPWKSFLRSMEKDGEALRQQYYRVDADNSFRTSTISKMRALIEDGRESDWQELVLGIVDMSKT